MFDHVTIRASDPEESERFYDAVLGVLDIPKSVGSFGDGCQEFAEWEEFSIAPGAPTTGLHLAFAARSREEVDTFWRTGLAEGFRSDGEPGLRTRYRDDYYGAFLLDPDDNSIEAVYHGDATRDNGYIDHMWIRVRDVDDTRAFYETLSDYTGYPLFIVDDYRVHFGHPGDHFAIVQGSPLTHNLHLAFAADSDEKVDAFHAAALDAGYRDNGEPGERPHYHDGYYGAFVLDPAGINVELVNHRRT